MSFEVAITGDAIVNRPLRHLADEGFLRLADLLRRADCSITHLETLLHDYTGPEVYPAAEAGWTWMRSPAAVADELRWLGVDAVSLASNHSLDYSYGGLRATWAALERAGLPHAGTGEDLHAAATPAAVQAGGVRVGLVSMTSTFGPWSRAGAQGEGVGGRPGVNPLLFAHVLSPEQWRGAAVLWKALGYWVTEVDDGQWWVNPPGLHNCVTRFTVADDGRDSALDGPDVARHEAAVAAAAERFDVVVVHVHNHEWDVVRGLSYPPSFIREFARRCIDRGADVFVAQGSHAPLRGVEVYRGRPILYDPGDFMLMSGTVDRLPHDYYDRHRHGAAGQDLRTQAGRWAALEHYQHPEHPPGGYRSGPVQAGVVCVCSFDDALVPERLTLHPFRWSTGDLAERGVPLLVGPGEAEPVIAAVRELSAPFGTTIATRDGRGVVELGQPAGSS